jgi:hypothetical protein
MASIFLALAALVSRPGRRTWLKAALAGLAVGFSITEGFDNGAIFSLYVAAFALYQSWLETGGTAGRKLWTSVARVAVIALFATFMAAQALSTLIGTQIQGMAQPRQDAESKQADWDLKTAGSLPKIETLRVVIPGLFGYRLTLRKVATTGVPPGKHLEFANRVIRVRHLRRRAGRADCGMGLRTIRGKGEEPLQRPRA